MQDNGHREAELPSPDETTDTEGAEPAGSFVERWLAACTLDPELAARRPANLSEPAAKGSTQPEGQQVA